MSNPIEKVIDDHVSMVIDYQKNDEIINAKLQSDRNIQISLLDQHPVMSAPKSRLVRGVIIEINKKKMEVLVEIVSEGYSITKSQAFLHMSEFGSDPIDIGLEYEFFIENFEVRDSVLSLSRSKVKMEHAWLNLKNAHANSEMVEGIIFNKINGGLCVDFDGIIAFLPGSQIDIRIIKDVGPIMNKVQPFKVISVDENAKTAIVSRRAVLEGYRSSQKVEFIEKIKEGDVLDGTVKNITNYGVFVDLGVMDGLLHVADITWNKISHPSEVLAIGDVVKVKVISIDQEKKRISLGVKQLQENPWSKFKDDFQIGQIIEGTVTNVADYGIFVELKKDIEGLIHQTEISWLKEETYDFLKSTKIGDKIKVYVSNIDIENHRISLSIKQLQENPWKKFIEERKVNDVIEGSVTNITSFGIFVNIGHKINGLVYISDLTWDQNQEQELAKYKVGDAIKVMYLSGDPDKQRISLGVKQLLSDPISDLKDVLKEGEIVTATITAVNNDGIELKLFEKLTTYIKKAHIARDKTEQRTTRFNIGDKVDVMITKVDFEKRSVTTSIRKLEEEKYKEVIEKYGSTNAGATLGDILGVSAEELEDK